MIRVGVLGATGYAGAELVRLLSMHEGAEIKVLVSHSYAGKKISEVYPSLKGVCDIELCVLDIGKISEQCDIVFTALPHGVSKTVIPELYKRGLKIIDFSGDYRYRDPAVYEKWYGEAHSSPGLLGVSVYGLPELHREEIKKARLIGNPGCYTTCSILGIAPLLKYGVIDTENIIIDAKSGVSGAGRNLALDYHFCECTENLKAYKVATHRHTSEIEQELGLIAQKEIILSFTPHLVPMKRGILATIYANLLSPKLDEDLLDLYREFYRGEYYVRVYESGSLPETKHVIGSNFIDIGLVVDKRLNRVVIVSALDNLIKGAAGQAIQNMNLLFGLDEKTGISNGGFFI